jgi:plastocyanin
VRRSLTQGRVGHNNAGKQAERVHAPLRARGTTTHHLNRVKASTPWDGKMGADDERNSMLRSRPMTVTPVVALVAVLLTGCGGDDDDQTSAPQPATTQQEAIPAVVKVSVGDNFYKPKELTIKRGQSISWRNEGAVAHTVTSDTDSSVKFDSGTLDPRGVYALKPTTPGKITYHCTIHGKVQSGTVTVDRG